MTDPLEQLRALEESLWRAETRYDAEHISRTFHRDFFEYGQSGATWTLATMATDGGPIDVELLDYVESEVAPGVVLTTYVSRKRDGSGGANRSSLWLLGDDGWRLRFHQGTPLPGELSVVTPMLRLMDTITLLTVLVVGLALGLALGAVVGVLWARSRTAYVETQVDSAVERAELIQGLDRLSDQMRDLDHQRSTWQGQLHEQVLDMRRSTELLSRETRSPPRQARSSQR